MWCKLLSRKDLVWGEEPVTFDAIYKSCRIFPLRFWPQSKQSPTTTREKSRGSFQGDWVCVCVVLPCPPEPFTFLYVYMHVFFYQSVLLLSIHMHFLSTYYLVLSVLLYITPKLLTILTYNTYRYLSINQSLTPSLSTASRHTDSYPRHGNNQH